MAGDAFLAYVEALEHVKAADKAFEDVLRPIQCAASDLRSNWSHVSVSGMSQEIGAAITDNRDCKVIIGSQWPSAEMIAEVILKRHQAYDEARNSWNQLPKEHRAAAQVPPTK
jgi:L-lactate utilization protein LutC